MNRKFSPAWTALFLGLLFAVPKARSEQCAYIPPGGVYRFGTHRVAVSQSFLDTAALQEFVWLDDGRAAAGYTGYSDAYPKRGVVRVFGRVSQKFTYQGAIVPPDSTTAFSGFGTQLAASGAFLATAGAMTNSSRGIYVYEATGPTDWTLRATLVADAPEANDGFGEDLAMSGRWLAVADMGPVGGIYLFRRDDAGIWQRHSIVNLPGYPGSLDLNNIALALQGDLLAVGQPQDGSSGSSFTGRVHLWRRQADDQWAFETSLSVAEGRAQDRFGFSLGLAGDRLFAGAPQRDDGDTDTGAIYAFRRANGAWKLESKIVSPTPRASANFGFMLACSATGSRLTGGELQGVHLFEESGTNWVHLGKNGGGDFFHNWESPSGTVANYLVGKTNSRPFQPIQRGGQTLVRFDGVLALIEQGWHAVTLRHVSNSVSSCIYIPTGFAANGSDDSEPTDQDGDGASDREEAYHGTFLDPANSLSGGLRPMKRLGAGGGFAIEWPHSLDTNLVVRAEAQWSPDLLAWSTNGVTVQKIRDEPENQREILEATVPEPPGGSAYFRLRFYLPDTAGTP